MIAYLKYTEQYAQNYNQITIGLLLSTPLASVLARSQSPVGSSWGVPSQLQE